MKFFQRKNYYFTNQTFSFCSTHGSSESQCWWSCSTASLSECSSPVSMTNAKKIAVKYYRLVMLATFMWALVELKIKFIHILGEWNWEEEGALLCKDIFSPRKLWLIFIGPMPVTYWNVKLMIPIFMFAKAKERQRKKSQKKSVINSRLYVNFMQKIN